MNAPRELPAAVAEVPDFLRRQQPARYGYWSDGTLAIAKGDDFLVLDADDIRALWRFVAVCEGIKP